MGCGCYCRNPSALGHRAHMRHRCWSPPGRWPWDGRVADLGAFPMGMVRDEAVSWDPFWGNPAVLGGSLGLGAAPSPLWVLVETRGQQQIRLLSGALSCCDQRTQGAWGQEKGFPELFKVETSLSVQKKMTRFRNEKQNKPHRPRPPQVSPAGVSPGCHPQPWHRSPTGSMLSRGNQNRELQPQDGEGGFWDENHSGSWDHICLHVRAVETPQVQKPKQSCEHSSFSSLEVASKRFYPKPTAFDLQHQPRVPDARSGDRQCSAHSRPHYQGRFFRGRAMTFTCRSRRVLDPPGSWLPFPSCKGDR